MPAMKIYEVHIVETVVRLKRIPATSPENLRAELAKRRWRIAPLSVPREIPSYEVNDGSSEWE